MKLATALLFFVTLFTCGLGLGYQNAEAQAIFNDEAHFQRRFADEKKRHEVEQRRIMNQREYDIAQARLRQSPRMEEDIEWIERRFDQRLDNERITHERRMNNIEADRIAARNRRLIDGIFNGRW